MKRITCDVLGIPIDVVTRQMVVSKVLAWAAERSSRYVCICNVHSLVTASQNTDFASVLQSADMNTPDGVPLVWTMRAKGRKSQDRIAGPDLIDPICYAAAQHSIGVFLYGSTPQTLVSLERRLKTKHAGLRIVGSISPPFGSLSDLERSATIRTINDSGAGIVWVGLGCPKQERWMSQHRGKINAVMIGVGAGFDYEVGHIKRAPGWMQTIGCEWLYRLAQEPRRLFSRYAKTNSKFLAITAAEFISTFRNRRG